MNLTTKRLVRGAAIAALYAAITLALRPISFGQWQFRVSEALTCLPMLMPEAIPGLTIGCFLANTLGSEMGIADMIFGTLASLIAAVATYYMRHKLKLPPALCMLPPVLVNAIVIGLMLNYVLELPLFLTMLEVGVGQLGACYLVGLPLYYLFKRLMPSL